MASTSAAAAASAAMAAPPNSVHAPTLTKPEPPRPAASARPKGYLHFVAGGVGGMCGAIVTSPLDVVKTRLQSDLYKARVKPAVAGAQASGAGAAVKRLAYHFVETSHLLAEIASKEGPKALFKGLGPTLVGAVPARAINFYTYGNGKVLLAEQFNEGKEGPLVHLGAAAVAGIVTATATNPIWVVKTRLQLDAHQIDAARASVRAAAVASRSASTAASSSSSGSSSASSSVRPLSTTAATSPMQKTYFRASSPRTPGPSSVEMTLRILRAEGVRGLYKGMSASYLGVAEGTIQWALYERLKKMGTSSSALAGEAPKQQGWATTIGAAGAAKMVASLITYPHEVVRTRLRQQPEAGMLPKYTGIVQTVGVVWREEGAAALYGGLSAHLMRVVPNAAIMFSVYELALYLGARSAHTEEQQRKTAETSTQ